MNLLIITFIGAVIGAAIGWYITSKRKGRFTRVDINDDWCHYKNDLGLTEVTVTRNKPNEMMICMKLERKKDEPLIIWLEDIK